jgi:hypothetical protein
MRRRIYKLKTTFTILGMDAVDWAMIIGTFAVTVNLFQSVLGGRSALLLSLICTALVYFSWHLLKDRVPENFSTHLIRWLAEPEVYKVVPDLQNVPLVVDFEEIHRVANKGNYVKKRENAFTDQLYKHQGKPHEVKPRVTKPSQPSVYQVPVPLPPSQNTPSQKTQES